MSDSTSIPRSLVADVGKNKLDLETLGSRLRQTSSMLQRQKVAKILKRPALAFPGSLPTTLTRAHLDHVRRRSHWILAKTDGLRCLLYLASEQTTSKSSPVQFLVDRTNEYYRLQSPPYQVRNHSDARAHSRNWHRGTLFDGELADQTDDRGGTQLMFVVFDCLAMDGQDITQNDYAYRRSVMKVHFFDHIKLFNDSPEYSTISPAFRMHMKETYEAEEADFLWNEVVPLLEYKVDGLIFIPKTSSYVAGTDRTVLKWKAEEDNTVDFAVKFPPTQGIAHVVALDSSPAPNREIDLFVHIGRGQHEKFASLTLTREDWNYFETNRGKLDGKILECFLNQHQEWRPKMRSDGAPLFRNDKKYANYISVVKDILAAAQHPVGNLELFQRLRNLRDT